MRERSEKQLKKEKQRKERDLAREEQRKNRELKKKVMKKDNVNSERRAKSKKQEVVGSQKESDIESDFQLLAIDEQIMSDDQMMPHVQ